MDRDREAYQERCRTSGDWGAPFFLLGALMAAATALIVTPWKGDRVRGKLQGARKTRTEEVGKAIDSAIEAGKELHKRTG